MATFGERLAELRKGKGLSQADLAGFFKLGQSTIGMYETNKREPDSTVLKGFADFFGVTIDYLLGRDYTFSDMAGRLTASPSPRPDPAIELLDLLEESSPAQITAGGQPISDAQRLAVLRSLINPAKARAKLRVPVVGYIRAGIPLLSEQNLVGEVDIPADLEGSVDFALIVHGDSMIGVGIAEGDLVLCKSNPLAPPGQIVVALVNDDETTLKYFVKDNDGYVLRAANPEYPDMALKPGDQIQGQVVKIVKDPPSVNLYRDYIYVKDGHLEEWNQVIEEAVSYGIKPDQIRSLVGMQRDMLKRMLGGKQ